MPTDTTKIKPERALARAMVEGSNNFIENMEAEGQKELVQEGGSRIPTELMYCKETDLRRLGFKLGAKVQADPLFRQAELPVGWSVKATEHSMHSDIVDDEGRVRGDIFYKAAYYDRKAHLTLNCRYIMMGKHPKDDSFYPYQYGVRDNATGEWIHLDHDIVVGLRHPGKGTAGLIDGGDRSDKWLVERYPDHRNPLAYWDEDRTQSG